MDGPGNEKFGELVHAATEVMGAPPAMIVGGTMRVNDTDATVGVALSEYNDERPFAFVWVPLTMRWYPRPDIDADRALGLIEWRRIRHDRRDGDEYDAEA